MNRNIALLTTVAAASVIAGCTGSLNTSLNTSTGPRTRAERTGYLETSHYADVIAFLDSLKGRPELTFGSIGKAALLSVELMRSLSTG